MPPRNLKRIQPEGSSGGTVAMFSFCITLSTNTCVGSCVTCWQSSGPGACVLAVIWIVKEWEKVQISEYCGKSGKKLQPLSSQRHRALEWDSDAPRTERSSAQSFLPCVPVQPMTSNWSAQGWAVLFSFSATIFRNWRRKGFFPMMAPK